MGRASRRKRERRAASSQNNQAPVEHGSQGTDGRNVDRQGTVAAQEHNWGGRRPGAGRPRIHTNDAERQAAYRVRRRSGASSILENQAGKPPEGGAPDTT
jgi:hypothetical protein